MNILEKLRTGVILLSDGALGTMLQAKGLSAGECPEMWNLTHMNELREIAALYLQAGSDLITTNSFGGNRIKLSQYGLTEKVEELNRIAAEIYREVAGNDRHVAGSIGPTGRMLMMGDVTEDELYDAFSEQAAALEKGGADIIIIETMTAADEASIAVRAARENTNCTVIVTMTFSGDPDGGFHTMMGISPEDMVTAMKDAGAHIIGSNCGNGIKEMTGVLHAIRKADPIVPVIIQANAGMPEFSDGQTVFRETPELMASFVPELVKAGVNIIGGCCGTTPAHIRAIASALGR
jgi:5-methyltetrahydrofolate--homocysteine methyltransferase